MAKVTLTSKFSAMKSTLAILTAALFLSSCTTAYKSGQTPDDVYYSPERPQDEYVRTEKKYDRQYRYQDEGEYRDDRYLRMKVRDRRYSGLYDDYYSYNPYYYHYYNSSLYYNSPWSTYSYWNYYYNPYCSYCISCGTYPVRTTVKNTRTFDLSVYSPNQDTKTVRGVNIKGNMPTSYGSTNNPVSRNYGTGRSHTDSYRGSNRNAGDFLRDVFSGSNNSSSSGSSKGNSSSSSSSSSSGSSSGKSTNAGTRKF